MHPKYWVTLAQVSVIEFQCVTAYYKLAV